MTFEEGSANRFPAASLLRFGEDPFRLREDLLTADVSYFSRKLAQQLLRDIGMQLRFELRGRVSFLAAEDPLLKHAFVQGVLEEVGDELEMLAGLIGDAAFGVASVIAGKAVAATTAGQRMKESFAFSEFAQSQIEETGAMTIDQHDAEAGKYSQQLSQGFQVEMAIHEKLRAGQLRRQIVLAPEVLRRAGEDSLGMGAIAAQILREADDAIEIGAGRLELVFMVAAALASTFQLAHGFTCQILGKDRLFLVGLVARRGGLKVEAESAG